MVDSPYFEMFQKDSIDKQLRIEFDGGVITNEELHSQQFELTESLCSESELRFGSCEASSIKFKISNVFTPLKDKWLTVSMTLKGNTAELFLIGKYKVYSDVPTADRRFRDVVAYDAMYDIINSDVAEWYNSVLPNKDSTMPLKEFRTRFIQHFGLEQDEADLINDDMPVLKTIEPSEISGKDVITAICEINGCFGHIGRDGKFQYVVLKELVEGLYPRNDLYPRDDLYPADPMNSHKISKSHYISADYEDFKTERIRKLQIRQEENDIGCIYGNGDNCYIVQDNFLVYGKSSEELRGIAAKLYGVIYKIWYRPARVEAKGNPCLEVGDGIRLRTKYEIIYTYILQRTLKGIQALRDTYEAEGEQYQTEKANSVRESIIQLKGKTNTLTRTIEETDSRITDVEEGLSTQIKQNEKQILLEAQRAADAEEKLSASIKLNAESITTEVNRATEAEGSLSSRISLNAGQISLKVNRDSLISEINQTAEKVTISAGKIDLNGLVSAEELVSKFATIVTLNATTANLNNLISAKATIESLDASNARISSLEVDHVSVNEFNASNANLQNLIAQKIDASTVKAQYMEVENWTSAGYIKASKIDVDDLFAGRVIGTIYSSNIQAQSRLGISGSLTFNNRDVVWGTIIDSKGNKISCLVEG